MILDEILGIIQSGESASKSYDEIIQLASLAFTSDSLDDLEKKDLHLTISCLYGQLDDNI